MAVRKLAWTAAAVALLPAPLFAQDLTPTGARILSDPTYLPLAGQLFGDSAYSYDTPRLREYDPAGTEIYSRHGGENIVTQTFEYGVTNDLSLLLSDDYSWTHADTTLGGGTQNHLNSNGFQDPTFGVIFRAIDQRAHPFSLDFTGAYSPDIISAQGATASSDGSIARGGDMVDLRGALGRETRALTLQAYVDGRHFGGETSSNGVGGQTTSSAYWQTTLGLASQTRFTDRLSLNLGAAYSMVDDYNRFNTATSVPSTVMPGDFTTVNLSLNYHLIPNRLVGSIDYGHTFYDHGDVDFPLTPANNYMTHRDEDAIGAQLRYVFR